jgi:nucleotide-binding universal stress UspA family protein
MSEEPIGIDGRALDYEPFRSRAADRLSEREGRGRPIERILCPIDFSETSRTALRHAIALAKWYEAEIRALHVMDMPPIAGPEAPAVNGISASADARVEVRHRLREFLEPVESAGVRATLSIRAGDTVEQIVDQAAACRADLVVIGTRGLSGIRRLVLGSTAERVLRSAPCPILTVPPHASPTPSCHDVPFSRILCPVNFSELSLSAVGLALSLAQEVNGTLTLFHAVNPVAPSTGGEHIGLEEPSGYELRELEQDALGELRGLIPDEVRAWCNPEATVVADAPVRAILDAAKQLQTDLIVMSLRPRGGLDRMLFGSKTEAVAREATCPVLTIRHAQRMNS